MGFEILSILKASLKKKKKTREIEDTAQNLETYLLIHQISPNYYASITSTNSGVKYQKVAFVLK